MSDGSDGTGVDENELGVGVKPEVVDSLGDGICTLLLDEGKKLDKLEERTGVDDLLDVGVKLELEISLGNGTGSDSVQLANVFETSELVDQNGVDETGVEVGVLIGEDEDSLGDGLGDDCNVDTTGAEGRVVGSGVKVEGADVVEFTPGGPLYVRDHVSVAVKLDGVLDVTVGMTGNDVFENVGKTGVKLEALELTVVEGMTGNDVLE